MGKEKSISKKSEESIVKIDGQDKSVENKKEPTPKALRGMVFNCSMLNVRETPNTNGTVTNVIQRGARVSIDASKSTDTFYSIKTDDGITGFCMTQYIKVF